MRRYLLIALGVLAVIVLLTSSLLAADANSIARGKDYFQNECVMCHQVVSGGGGDQGPPLNGIVGRPAGSVPGFPYSKALIGSGKVWTEKNLETFLADPPSYIPGTKMPINVGDAQDRTDLIAFLASTKK